VRGAPYRIAVLLALLICGAAGCDHDPVDPSEIEVARVGDRPLYLSDFQRYLAAHLIEAQEGEEAPTENAAVKSRLFDAFVDEHVLLAEARHRGIVAEPWEVDAYLAADEPEEGQETPDPINRWFEAESRLLVQKLREEATSDLSAPTEPESRAYADLHREALAPERYVKLRALMFDSMDEARRVYREIRRRRMTFNEAVVHFERYPGQSQATTMDWETLPEDVRAALDGLKAGRVGEPVQMGEWTYIFRLESWLTEPEQMNEVLLQRARGELQQLRRQEALDALLRDARERTEVRLNRTRLPFEYVAE
jgi:hypothetical protein